MQQEKPKRWLVRGMIGLIFALFIFILLVAPLSDTDVLYTHLVIHGVPVGGLTAAAAEEALQARFQPEVDALRITYVLDGETIAERGFADFDARFDFSEVVAAAREYGNKRNLWQRMRRILGRPYEVTTTPVFRFDPARVEAAVLEIGEKLYLAPMNARFFQEKNEIVILPEKPGRTTDTTAAATATIQLITQLSSGMVELTTSVLPPRYVQADLKFPLSLLGEYSTFFAGENNDPRTRNIKRAAGRIHNQVILPEEIFSAGTVIAAHLPDSGYETALVLVRGEPVEDIGGGVCQVATTLYNAVLRAELSITQRHNHSARVSYADFGFDATLAGTWYDLKFRNNTPQPLLLTADVSGGRLSISLHGLETRPAGRTIRFTSERTNITSPEPYKEIPDPDLLPGERVIVLESVLGYTYEVFKHVYLNGKAVERVSVNTSVYRPLQGVMHVGVE